MSFEKPSFEQPISGESVSTPEKTKRIEAEINIDESLLLYEKPSESEIENQREEKREEVASHEKYHDIKNEHARHIKKFDFKFMESEWQLVQESLGDYDPLTMKSKSSVISSREAFDFIHEQRMKKEKVFFDSLKNPEEQKARKEIREVLIRQLESVYDSLDKKAFTTENEEARSKELAMVLEKKGISGRNKEIQEILDSLYHPYGFGNKVLENKDKFIENALIQFDSLVFEEAQNKVLGRVRETTHEQAFGDKFEELQKRKSEKNATKKEEFLSQLKQKQRIYR